jgi:Domain of unknown function (DUF4826)
LRIGRSLPHEDHMDYPSEAEEQTWCDFERARVIEYLSSEGLVHGEVGDWPAWHVWPYVAVWAIESVRCPGWVGWWAVSGDLPIDYTGCGPDRHPREGLRDIASLWKEAAKNWSENKSIEEWRIGAPEDWPTLAPLLATRAELLLAYAADDDLWLEN